ncbi:MAG TPA: c-type cytochrome [Gemmatimonadales bacterium]|jgi:mono/diheme cytochrome c family protein
MDPWIRNGLLTALVVLVPLSAVAQTADSLPPGVTREMVTKGKSVFGGAGLCLACHGPDGKGSIGPDLTDREWLHGDGSYGALVKLITTGVDQKQSKTGQMMPPKGGSAINEADLRAVTAYVWSLSRRAAGR